MATARRRVASRTRATSRALADLAVEPRAIGKLVNLGSTGEISITALAERVCELAGVEVRIERRPHAAVYATRFVETRRRVPDLARLEDLIGWVPGAALDEWIVELLGRA